MYIDMYHLVLDGLDKGFGTVDVANKNMFKAWHIIYTITFQNIHSI